ncbi:hypothetical protein M002_29190 [Pseudomonas aeruginosa ID4365]|nr:hypothetical protein M002_29190 [Pseudomonas aeruginosa ID4365]
MFSTMRRKVVPAPVVALLLQRIQVGQQVDRRGGTGDEFLPQRHAHGGAVWPAPAQKGRACASLLLGQFRGQQVKGMPGGLPQHAPLRQGDELVPLRVALAGPVVERPLTFKRS